MLSYNDAMGEVQALTTKQQAIIALAKDEERELTPEEVSDLDSLETDIEKATATAERLKKVEDRAAELAELRPAKTKPVVKTENRLSIPATEIRTREIRGFGRGREACEAAYRAGRFFAAALYGHGPSIQYCQDYGLDPRNALSTGDNQKGAILVPTEVETAIIDLKEERGVFARECGRTSMSSDTKTVPRRNGGVTAYAVGDNTEITASDKDWNDVNLVAKKFGVLVKYSSELDEDAFIDLASDLSAEIAYAFADKEDECGFNGDGTSTYGGITGVYNAVLAGSVHTAATGNTAFSTLDLLDFEQAMAKLPQYADMNAKWYIHKTGYWDSMGRLLNAGGGNTIGTLESGPGKRMFAGHEVVFSQVLNSTQAADTSANKAVFGDLRQSALYGSRRSIRLDISTDRYFELDQLAIKGTVRFDIVVHDKGTASVAGGLVVLKTPAS